MHLKYKIGTDPAHCSAKELGRWGEAFAERYLTGLGYGILERNWRHALGELDLIVYDPARGATVAVEVKTRRGCRSGTPEEAVTAQKLKRIRVLLTAWSVSHGCRGAQIEVDVLALAVKDGYCAVNHLKGL